MTGEEEEPTGVPYVDDISLDMFVDLPPAAELLLLPGTEDVNPPVLAPAIFGRTLFGDAIEPSRSLGKLGTQFIIPPFSILDTRQGYWQDRKRAWLALGLRSELGRVKDAQATGKGSVFGGTSEWTGPRGATIPDSDAPVITGGNTGGVESPSAGGLTFNTTMHPYDRKPDASAPETEGPGFFKGDQLRQNPKFQNAGGNLLKFSPMMSITRDGAGFDGGKIYSGEIDLEDVEDIEANSTSIFDPVLCELSYRWFCPPGGTVLDPFAGGSVRGVVAGLLGREYVGVELRPEQVEANRTQWEQLGVKNMALPELRVQWIEGDSRDCENFLPKDSCDFVFSCPPYADLERYSDDPRDLSTLRYEDFVTEYRLIIQRSCSRLKADRFAAFVVTEIRGPKEGIYRGFVKDTVEAFQNAGLKYYNEAALINCAGSLPLRVQKQFRATRKLGRTHQYVLVFLKGDPRKAADACADQEEGA